MIDKASVCAEGQNEIRAVFYQAPKTVSAFLDPPIPHVQQKGDGSDTGRDGKGQMQPVRDPLGRGVLAGLRRC